jgi:hypothetical protein
MIRGKFFKNALVALVTVGAVVCTFTGCNREDVPKSSPESYMNDSAFMKTLDAMRREQAELAAAHHKLAAQMKVLVAEAKQKLKTEDLGKIKAELEKSDEWKSLYSRCQDAATAVKESRRKMEAFVRKRISK